VAFKKDCPLECWVLQGGIDNYVAFTVATIAILRHLSCIFDVRDAQKTADKYLSIITICFVYQNCFLKILWVIVCKWYHNGWCIMCACTAGVFGCAFPWSSCPGGSWPRFWRWFSIPKCNPCLPTTFRCTYWGRWTLALVSFLLDACLQHCNVRVFSHEFMTSSSRILGCERAECQPSCCIVSLIFSGSVSVSTATWGLALRQRPTVLHIRGSYITLSLCYTVSVMTALPPEIQLWPYVLFCSWMLSRLRYITLGTEWSM
jgi:hypothetical protein